MNVINKVFTLLLLISCLLFYSCHKTKTIELINMSDVPIYIKFNIPKDVIGKTIDTNGIALIKDEIKKEYPTIMTLKLDHCQKFINGILYLEFTGTFRKQNIIFFAFKSSNKISIKALNLNMFSLRHESRYKLSKKDMHIYKILNSGNTIISVAYYYDRNLISISCDDGYSVW